MLIADPYPAGSKPFRFNSIFFNEIFELCEYFGLTRDPAQSADLLPRVSAHVRPQTVSDQMHVGRFDSEISLIHSFELNHLHGMPRVPPEGLCLIFFK